MKVKMKDKKYRFEKMPCPMCVLGFNSENKKGLNPECKHCKGKGYKRVKTSL